MNGNVRADVVDGSAVLDAVVAVGVVVGSLEPAELGLPEEAPELLEEALEPEEPDVEVEVGGGLWVEDGGGLWVEDAAGCRVPEFPFPPESGSTYC